MIERSETVPRQYPGVMVSSTFTDLQEHRAALLDAIAANDMMAVAMEHDSAKPVDIIDSSLQMVADASAYVGIISHKYGQTPECSIRNPQKLSITELELVKARELGRPILLFIMGDRHDVKAADVEPDSEKRAKLTAFREQAKHFSSTSSVHRVYKVFESLEDFRIAAMQSMAELQRHLSILPLVASPPTGAAWTPAAPELYAEPPYIGSHRFTGRQAQLDILTAWAAPSDAHALLLFEAIGGTGKSMLTWQWTTNYATAVRNDWAGRFWYSFYEKGAVMADFCRRALSYMTGRSYEELRKKKTTELATELVAQLRRRPWLLVLDGLERVLVAYHRFDAAQINDEEASVAIDQVAERDPSSAIRTEDDDLLRFLTGATPSKVLVTSRLVPRVLLNRSGRPLPGVRHEVLPGLLPEDAEALLLSCGVRGKSEKIQHYLEEHCDCHPLVVGIVGGLVNYYMPDRGNFDAWADDPAAGGHLNLAALDLVQKRNHILHAALDSLPEKTRDLLSTLALLSEAVEYQTLDALNPYMPPEPPVVPEPKNPTQLMEWRAMSAAQRETEQKLYAEALDQRAAYERARLQWQVSDEVRDAPQRLVETVRDLEARGLLQYDVQSKRYDLHPVVRGVAAGRLPLDDRERYGRRVIDHFSLKTHDPYEQAETLDDVRIGLRIVRTFLQMDRFRQAYSAYEGDLSNALFFNLEAYAEVLSIVHAFFPRGWGSLPAALLEGDAIELTNDAAFALTETGAMPEAIQAYEALLRAVQGPRDWRKGWLYLVGTAVALDRQNRLAKEERCLIGAMRVAERSIVRDPTFVTRLHRFHQLSRLGRWEEAEAMWHLLDSMGRKWSRAYYRPGTAEYRYAQFRFWRGDLKEWMIAAAEQLADAGNSRATLRECYALRGEWHVSNGLWAAAAESFGNAVRMAREAGRVDVRIEAQLALTKFHRGNLLDPETSAEQLSGTTEPSAQPPIAQLWFEIGDRERARRHALAAYRWAWADGTPYVRYHALQEARKLLQQVGAQVPDLPIYESFGDAPFWWEKEIKALPSGGFRR